MEPMNEQSKIERIVMRRVRTIRLLRPFSSGFTVVCLLLVVTLWGIGREVWVARVFANGPQDFFGHALYFAYAFEHTRMVVQALALVCAASVIYLARETARLVSATFIRVRA